MKKHKIIYLVSVMGGAYDERWDRAIFVTESKEVAEAYVQRHNRILSKLKERYSYIENGSVEGAHTYQEYARWIEINDIDGCYYTEIELRNE